jgi:hypothetical protein
VTEDQDALAVYRVTFVGDELPYAAEAALAAAGASWEGSESGPEHASRHRVLARARSEHEAIVSVRGVVASRGSFGQYAASPVRDSQGNMWRGPVFRRWDEIDWQVVPERAALSDVDRAVLGALADAGEATWIVARAPGVQLERANVEVVLERLEDQRLVYSVLEAGGERGRESEPDRWWALTDRAWDLLGLIKSPNYR